MIKPHVSVRSTKFFLGITMLSSQSSFVVELVHDNIPARIKITETIDMIFMTCSNNFTF